MSGSRLLKDQATQRHRNQGDNREGPLSESARRNFQFLSVDASKNWVKLLNSLSREMEGGKNTLTFIFRTATFYALFFINSGQRKKSEQIND